ncbi:SH2 domain-containing protein 7-like [Toxotes jaculatrix]|uniref:SH2 domain-containing protein 7-like n=1 Tax=Toxotes jaculatrix TaxID=941984 RepID=UPI001B3AD9C2|nr:SH2 domain-containing protein 7-like [Toxotes jaculatrix]
MFAEMTPGSNRALLISGKGSRTKEQKNLKSPSFRNCLKFCFKDRARMEQREAHKDSHAELTEGRFRELASKWFIETQVPLIVHNGFFPTWFLGFITRKDAEEILREKELGCFLVRLSDKAIGYILSYKGKDRCRHFVINQSETGQFVVCGDNEGHNTVPALIEYYKTSPIEPFGEYLTSSCFEVMNEDLYDTIQISPKEKPVAALRAVKNVRKQQTNLASEQPRARPPKSNRTLEEVPPLPQRSRHFDSGPLTDQDRVCYAQLRKIPRSTHTIQGHLPGDNPGRVERSTSQDQNIIRYSPPLGRDSIYSDPSLLESSKSRSLPLLDNSSDGEHSHRLSAPPHTPPRLSPKPIRPCAPRAEKTESCSMDYMSDSAVYHLAGKPGNPHTASSKTNSFAPEQRIDSVYAEVPSGGTFSRFSQDNTYELVPGHEDSAHPKPNSNTYEPLEDVRPKVLKNDRWKWLFPEAKRKW